MRQAFRIAKPLATPIARAFTLVELLVVVGVIALLIGILMPALGMARQSAYRIKCQSNLRQIGLAYQLYQQSTKGVASPTHLVVEPTAVPGQSLHKKAFYAWTTTTSNYDPHQGWLTPYYRNIDVPVCPLLTEERFPLRPTDIPNNYALSYAGHGPSSSSGMHSARWIRHASETVMWADALGVTTTGTTIRLDGLPKPSVGMPGFHGRHNRKGNVLWFDGHVSAEPVYVPRFPLVLPAQSAGCVKMNVGFLTPVPSSVNGAAFQNHPDRDYYFKPSKI